MNKMIQILQAIVGSYISNDVDLDAAERQILLITGPNMAGKSTYLRQVGLITLLAQIGGAHAGEDAIHKAHMRRVRGDEMGCRPSHAH